MGVDEVGAAAIAGVAAVAGYTLGVLAVSRTNEMAEPTSKSKPKMKAYRGALVEVKEKVVTDFSIDDGVAKKGAALFKAKCAACHSCIEGGPTKQGPNLWNIMGKDAAKSAGFKFTKNLKGAEIKWDNESMFAWLENPKVMVKGTSMAFPGFKKEQDRADVIAYLNTLSPDAPPQPSH